MYYVHEFDYMYKCTNQTTHINELALAKHTLNHSKVINTADVVSTCTCTCILALPCKNVNTKYSLNFFIPTLLSTDRIL